LATDAAGPYRAVQAEIKGVNRMTIHYQVHLSGGAVDLDAAAINLGQRRLWFYDSRDNLLAVFRWESILGFTVKESAEGQEITEEFSTSRS
jgi:hypothetical protein